MGNTQTDWHSFWKQLNGQVHHLTASRHTSAGKTMLSKAYHFNFFFLLSSTLIEDTDQCSHSLYNQKPWNDDGHFIWRGIVSLQHHGFRANEINFNDLSRKQIADWLYVVNEFEIKLRSQTQFHTSFENQWHRIQSDQCYHGCNQRLKTNRRDNDNCEHFTVANYGTKTVKTKYGQTIKVERLARGDFVFANRVVRILL